MRHSKYTLTIEPHQILKTQGYYCTLEDREGKIWGASIWHCSVWQAIEFAARNAKIVLKYTRCLN